MGRILTERYSLLFEKKVGNPFLFAHDVYKSGKLRELSSFVVWELFHRLRLFPKKQYLKFNSNEVISLDNLGRLKDTELNKKIDRLFSSRGLNVTKSDHNWKLLFINKNQDIFGCLYPDDRELYKSTDQGQSITFVKKFPERIKSIFISSQNTIFVCVKGAVYKSSDNGNSFKKSLDLGSSISFFRHNNEMTETPDNTLIIGEYGNIWENGWRKLAYLYFSSDEGETWGTSDFLIKKGTNKHVHLVKYSKLFNKVFMADGDNYKKLWVSDALNSADLQEADNWTPVNRFHIQMGGYTSVIEDEEKIVFGTDYQGGTNFFVETRDGKTFTKRIVPDPYRRSPIDNMVQRRSKNGNEIWANLPYSTANSKCLLMYTADGGESWNKVVEYSRATHKVWLLISANEMANDLYFSIENLKNKERVVYKVNDQ